MSPTNPQSDGSPEARQILRHARALARQAMPELPREASFEQEETHFLHRLSERLDTMLAHEPARLQQLLYRVDVEEKRVREVLRDAPLDKVSERLATLVWERLWEKARWRAHFSGR